LTVPEEENKRQTYAQIAASVREGIIQISESSVQKMCKTEGVKTLKVKSKGLLTDTHRQKMIDFATDNFVIE
jgi:hypothetical protein